MSDAIKKALEERALKCIASDPKGALGNEAKAAIREFHQYGARRIEFGVRLGIFVAIAVVLIVGLWLARP